MAATKKTMFLFLCVLVAAVAVVLPVAEGIVILRRYLIKGTVFCTLSGNGMVGSSPPFKNATVELRCGSGTGSLVSTALTNSTGQFAINVNNSPYSVAQVLSKCRVVVVTSLKKCHSTLPSVGTLTSKLAFNGTISEGPVKVSIFTTTKFSPSPLP